MTTNAATMHLQTVRVRNFKAIVDSRTLRFGPLTVFIGNNGSGKSSVIEALETYQAIVTDGLDVAMQRWRGIEHARHKGAEAAEGSRGRPSTMNFDLTIGASARKSTRIKMEVSNDTAANRMSIAQESIEHANGWIVEKSVVSANLNAPRIPS